MIARALVALVSGALFAVGLGVAGMTDARKVLAFLNVRAWDPSLVFVMVGAIAVHVGFAQYAKRGRPLLAERFVLPSATSIDRKLLLGAALFGVGWGAAGFCPGPALVSLLSGTREAWLFCVAMALGMVLVDLGSRGSRGSRA